MSATEKSYDCVTAELPTKTLLANECSEKSSEPQNSSIYDLYKHVKKFSCYMPKKWKGRELDIFIQTCMENIEFLRNGVVDEWLEEIAKIARSKSKKTFLFTFDSCKEVAKGINSFFVDNVETLGTPPGTKVLPSRKTRNKSCLGSFYYFNRFREDIAPLLPYFNEMGVTCDIKDFGDYFETELAHETVSKLIHKKIDDIKAGKEPWEELNKEMEQIFGLSPNLKRHMKACKEAKIFDSLQIDDPSLRKKAFLSKNYSDVWWEVFDYIEPLQTKKIHLFSGVKGKENQEFMLSGVPLYFKMLKCRYLSHSQNQFSHLFLEPPEETYKREIMSNTQNTEDMQKTEVKSSQILSKDKQNINAEIPPFLQTENNPTICKNDTAPNVDRNITRESVDGPATNEIVPSRKIGRQIKSTKWTKKRAREAQEGCSGTPEQRKVTKLTKVLRKRKQSRPGTRQQPRRETKNKKSKEKVESHKVEPHKEVVPQRGFRGFEVIEDNPFLLHYRNVMHTP